MPAVSSAIPDRLFTSTFRMRGKSLALPWMRKSLRSVRAAFLPPHPRHDDILRYTTPSRPSACPTKERNTSRRARGGLRGKRVSPIPAGPAFRASLVQAFGNLPFPTCRPLCLGFRAEGMAPTEDATNGERLSGERRRSNSDGLRESPTEDEIVFAGKMRDETV
jgi:hypothetical protein